MSSRSAVSRVVVIMRPENRSSMSMGMRPEWSIWGVGHQHHVDTAGMEGQHRVCPPHPSLLKTAVHQNIPFRLTSKQWQLPVTHQSAP